MNATAIIQAILSLIKAIPWFQKKFDELMLYYATQEVKRHDSAFSLAMAVLIRDRDQTKLEEAIGSDNAGKPAIRRDGVRERPHVTTPSDPIVP